MTKKEQLEEIKARRDDRKHLLSMVPEWMWQTRAYLEKLEKRDKRRAHLIRCGKVDD